MLLSCCLSTSASKRKKTDSCLLRKMRVSCSACADWPRALQKHKQRVTLNNPAFPPTQVTPGHDAERQLTREKNFHTRSACLSTAARSEKHVPLQSAKIDLKAQFFCSPAPRQGSESKLSLTAKSQHSEFWPRLLDQSSPRSQDRKKNDPRLPRAL